MLWSLRPNNQYTYGENDIITIFILYHKSGVLSIVFREKIKELLHGREIYPAIIILECSFIFAFLIKHIKATPHKAKGLEKS